MAPTDCRNASIVLDSRPFASFVDLPSASFPVADYDLASTLECGQAFRWTRSGAGWEGVVEGRWVRVEPAKDGLVAWTCSDPGDWGWLKRHLALEEDFAAVLASFPSDPPMTAAVAACRGLRLLRQEPWECLASFICSSTKQIVQIRQIVLALASSHGRPVAVPPGIAPAHSFPGAAEIAAAGEGALRACKLGFRAPYLVDAARRFGDGRLDLRALERLPTPEARAALMAVEGVGPKIADCVLLFAYGRQDAFPIDVWVRRALKDLYFPRARRLTASRLERFSATHFGSFSGYAQQYLFHYVRQRDRRAAGITPAAGWEGGQ